MSIADRKSYLKHVWVLSRDHPSRKMRLRLIEKAGGFRGTVPKSWPKKVVLYRGARAWSWRGAQRRVRTGICWTTDPEVANAHAAPYPAIKRPGESSNIGHEEVGCVGKAVVRRSHILAYFNEMLDSAYNDGSERECVIDPSDVTKITYERVAPAASPQDPSPSLRS